MEQVLNGLRHVLIRVWEWYFVCFILCVNTLCTPRHTPMGDHVCLAVMQGCVRYECITKKKKNARTYPRVCLFVPVWVHVLEHMATRQLACPRCAGGPPKPKGRQGQLEALGPQESHALLGQSEGLQTHSPAANIWRLPVR